MQFYPGVSLMVCYSRGNQAMEVTTVVNRFFFCKETTVKTKPSLSEIIQSAFLTPPPHTKFPSLHSPQRVLMGITVSRKTAKKFSR